MSLWNRLQTLVLPSICLLCNNNAHRLLPLCDYCEKTLPFLPKGCRYCALPLPDTVQEPICGACLLKNPSYDEIYALFEYTYPLTFLITGLKFANQWLNAPTLGALMATSLEKRYANKPKPQGIIPIPLHTQRLRERGYNQSLELARPLSKLLKIPLLKHAAQRQKPTLPQTKISLSKRFTNLKNAFSYSPPLPEYVAVVDDVFTTGHTLHTFCNGLKANGVKHIHAWIYARSLQWKK